MSDTLIIPTTLMRGEAPTLIPIEGTWIAGGSIRRWFNGEKQDSDVDVFGIDEATLTLFAETHGLTKKVHEHKNAVSYRKGPTIYQLIKIHSATPAETLDKFDFQHCRFAWDGKQVISTIEAVSCAIRKALMIHKIQSGYELDTLRRAFKYQSQGYKPCMGCLHAIAASFREVQEPQLREQLELSRGGGRRVVRFD